MVKALLFDFFGTLVEYQPDRAMLGAPRTHELAAALGFEGDHDRFVDVWDSASLSLEADSRRTLREFSMTDAAVAFGAATGLNLSGDEAVALGELYLEEWMRHVEVVPGVPDLIRRLAGRVDIAVVSNTHDRNMVPDMLDDMGVGAEIDSIVLSVDHGWIKPHDSMYTVALDRLGCAPPDAMFVGDTFEADYAGPIRAGMQALLIDPHGEHSIPAGHRIATVLDVATVLDRDIAR
ncbi:MAG: HAD family hydrolase [Ilumatobacteraceae bacterium]|nr:HAD family hydrolase [Ilumatobacteraceae bacterium]